MKSSYLFLLLIPFNMFSQNLVGDWYLDHIIFEGETRYSTIPNAINTIQFFENGTFQGETCDNGFNGSYNISSDYFISEFSALAGICNFTLETDFFLHPLFWNCLSPNNLETGTLLSSSFDISGLGEESILYLIREDGNQAVYTKTLPETNELPGVWYINQITYNNEVYTNSYNSSSFIEFTLDGESEYGINFIGEGVCNTFGGVYRMTNNTNFLDLDSYYNNSGELNSCETVEQNLFEDYLFDILSLDNDGIAYESYQFQVSGEGDSQELIITKTSGDSTGGKSTTPTDVFSIVLSRQPLSISDENKDVSVSLIQNPVSDLLFVKGVSLKKLGYEIFNINGQKLLSSNELKSNTIELQAISSGMYFIRFYNNTGVQKVIKFIKK
ncbi:T9SS type A sorting domain-containing protein [Mangrovimonas futianensis]|uniref:T9SS type A sorting domain-containing protein n=1 Tax=Mangrovimonas futianensis TaxID=2895523 RepID=UPI001E3295D7|nr:T9SS type A sorting domain-containing protein [Mangrovimonas futianensis]MCF1422157.1 T9SS type A sorting domain-containing protein [Mangrovimonas futianensis]